MASRKPATHDVQAITEGVEIDDGRIEFLGEHFRLADSIGLMPLLAFAASAKAGLDSDDMAGMAAMYALIRDTIDQVRPVRLGEDDQPILGGDGQPEYTGPSEWQRFERHAIDEKADGEDLMGFINRAVQTISARPTKPRGLSSGTSRKTSANTRGASSSPGTVARRRIPPESQGLVAIADIG